MITEADYLYHLLTAGQIKLSDYLEQYELYITYSENMKVTELGDSTVVIEKEHDDSGDFTIGKMFDGKNHPIVKIFVPDVSFETYRAKEYIFNDEVLIVYLDCVPPEFQIGTHVGVKVGRDWYETVFDRSKALT